jgi:hypothetical protein
VGCRLVRPVVPLGPARLSDVDRLFAAAAERGLVIGW